MPSAFAREPTLYEAAHLVVEMTLLVFLSGHAVTFAEAANIYVPNQIIHRTENIASLRKEFISVLERRASDSFRFSNVFLEQHSTNTNNRSFRNGDSSANLSSKNSSTHRKEQIYTELERKMADHQHLYPNSPEVGIKNVSFGRIYASKRLSHLRLPSITQYENASYVPTNRSDNSVQQQSNYHRTRLKRHEPRLEEELTSQPTILTSLSTSEKSAANSFTENYTGTYDFPSGSTRQPNTYGTIGGITKENILLLSSLVPMICALALSLVIYYVRKRKSDPERQKLVVKVVTGIYYDQTGYCF